MPNTFFLAACYELGQQTRAGTLGLHDDIVPNLVQVLELRQNRQAYTWFCEKLLRCVVGTRAWDKACAHERLSSYATITDEAFALLVFENNFSRWVDMYNKGNSKTSDVQPKWTNGGKSAKNGRSKMCGGWDVDGIKRYNTLFCKVEKDREDNPAFEDAFLKRMQSIAKVPRRRKATTNEIVEFVQPLHQFTAVLDKSEDEKEADSSDESSDDNQSLPSKRAQHSSYGLYDDEE